MGLFDFFRTESQQKQLQRFEEQLLSLERRVQSVELEWDQAYDKLHAMLGRIAKRAEKLHKEAEDNGSLAPLSESETSVPGLGTQFLTLTPRQRQVQAQIMRRRGGGNHT